MHQQVHGRYIPFCRAELLLSSAIPRCGYERWRQFLIACRFAQQFICAEADLDSCGSVHGEYALNTLDICMILANPSSCNWPYQQIHEVMVS